MQSALTRNPEQAPAINWRRFALPVIAAAVLLALSYPAYLWLDQPVAKWSFAHSYGWRTQAWYTPFRHLGKSWPILVPVTAWAILGRGKRALVAVVLAGILVNGAVFGVKGLVQRERPNEALQGEIHEPSFFYSWSFPSGDMAGTCALAVALIPFVALPWRIVLIAMMPVIGVMRMLAAYHYPSDITAGAAVGILCGLGGLAIYQAVYQWWMQRRALKENAKPPG
jgi:undecaprenyl-diphosphatase